MSSQECATSHEAPAPTPDAQIEAARRAISHLLRRLLTDARVAYYFGPASESFALLIEAHSLLNGKTVEEVRATMAHQMLFAPPTCRECGGAVSSTPTTPAAPYTLRFTEWRCGHHGQRPADIPVHSVEQAQLILQAIGCAISQPGHARAAIFDELSGTTIYMTDDHADRIAPGWPHRTTVFYATQEELAELQRLEAAYDYCYGGKPVLWDGTTFLDDMTAVTALDMPAIEAAIAPVEWHEQGHRRAVCDVPPVLKPAAELLEELREADAELQQVDADYPQEGGAA